MILAALPLAGDRVLDVGCGEGVLARELSRTVRHVTAIDVDAPTIASARVQGQADNVDFVVGDFLTAPFEPESFDAIVSVAAIHHMDPEAALERMRALTRPGGIIAVVGLARSQYPGDFGFDLAGAVATRLHKLRKTYWETSAPKIWPPPQTYPEMRRIAARVLPGARYRRHVLWRYSLVWTKPG